MYFRYEQSMFKFWIFNNLYIIVTQPEDIKFVLNNPKLLLKSKEYKVVQDNVGGQGIFSINDIHKWKENRLEMHIFVILLVTSGSNIKFLIIFMLKIINIL